MVLPLENEGMQPGLHHYPAGLLPEVSCGDADVGPLPGQMPREH